MKNGSESIKKQIEKHLSRGKSKLILLERQIIGDENNQTLQTGFGKAQEKLAKLKNTFNDYEEKAIRYTEKNPKKALAMASAAGILAGVLWSSFQKTKSTAPKTSPVKVKKVRLVPKPQTT